MSTTEATAGLRTLSLSCSVLIYDRMLWCQGGAEVLARFDRESPVVGLPPDVDDGSLRQSIGDGED